MSDLGKTKFTIRYCKTSPLDLDSFQSEYLSTPADLENEYMPFAISNLQNYNPVYSVFFEMNETNYNRISLNSEYTIESLSRIMNMETKETKSKDIFFKFSPLLDPVRYMIGKYEMYNTEQLETLPSISNTCIPKYNDANNAAYTDSFFSYLSSQLLNNHGFVNGIDFFGSYLGIQSKFKMNISDDIEYLNNSKFFNENVGVGFSITDYKSEGITSHGSRANKQKLQISSSAIILDTIENLDNEIHSNDPPNEIANEITVADLKTEELVYDKIMSRSTRASSDSSSSEPNYTSDEDNEEDKDQDDCDEESDDDASTEYSTIDESESDECSDEEEIFAYIKTFPIQMICLEKCKGTMDELLEKDMLEKHEYASALFQIVISLAGYQKAFQFTHNDLHTNNIMYLETDEKYLYYKYNGTFYKVPTHGKIFKIIDFGRSIYKFDGKIFCSDSFASDGDANTQYNCEPYMNKNKPRLEPNMSFDLCRLGCSIFDFIMDSDDDESELDDFQKTVLRWCTDDNGKNVLYKRNGEDRYPNFRLYRMIARTVHRHTPDAQFEFPYFNQFEISSKKMKKHSGKIIDIDELTCYV